jgi:hypothetical protein
LETDLVAEMMADGGVTGLISTRLYPLNLPQTPTYPAATYRIVSVAPVNTRDGNGSANNRVQFDCYGRTYADAKSVKAVIVPVLDGFKGTLGGGGKAHAWHVGEVDNFDGSTEVFRVTVDFMIFYR